MKPHCYFTGRGGCDGRLDRAHWISKSYIKRQFPYGAMRRIGDGLIAPCARAEQYVSGGVPWEPVSLDLVIWDPRCWTPICRKHHAAFDNHQFRIAREDLPPAVEQFAAEYFLLARLDHDYGEVHHEYTDAA